MADSWQCARVRLALLPKASSNRVYGESAFDLTVAELALVAEAAGLSLGEIERSEIGGVDHLIVEVDDDAAPLTARAIAVLSNLSRSEEQTSELQSLMRTSYAVLCLKTKKYKRTS